MKIFAQFLMFFFLSLFWRQTPEYNVHRMPLCAGDQLSFGNKSIKFKEVVSDSRCPKEVTCIWAGEAKVRVEFFKNGESLGEKVINGNKFSLNGIFQNEFEGSLNFTLSPYPQVNNRTQPSEYTLELNVTEKVE